MPANPIGRSAALARAALAGLLVLTLARLAFLAHFGDLRALAGPEALRALYLGLKFDLRLLALMTVPAWLLLKPGVPGGGRGWRGAAAPLVLALALALYAALVLIAMVDDVRARPWLPAFLGAVALYRGLFPEDGLAAAATRRVWGAFAGLLTGLVLLALFVDFGAYAYIHTRLNGTLLMFLDNPAISGRMVWESYPVLRLAAALAAGVALALWGLARLSRRIGPPPAARSARVAARALGTVLLVALMWGKWSRYPLRWGEAFEARQALHAHLALNPVLFLLETRSEMDGGYDLAEVKATHAALAAYFGVPAALDAEGLPTLERVVEPRPQVPGSPNLVFIQLESLAAFKTSPFGNPADPTPFLAGLCRDGVLFDRFHVVMENTSRSMFATLFGTPDVSSVQNATRNPLLVDQHTVLSAFPDYDKAYFLGGSANWAQIRAALRNNLPGIVLHEEGSYRSPVVDVWGVSDVDLLGEARERMGAMRPPFFAYVQTSGNHPPFTIPAHHRDFVRKDLPADELRRAGLTGNDEYNALRLMDHALARFFTEARKEPWFADTVFVLWGDHGIPRGSNDRRFGDLTLAIHRVPFLLYAPALLKPARLHTVASQLDILPTVASLVGRRAMTRTLGKDLFDPRFAQDSAAFTFTTFRRPPRYGLLQGDLYLNVEPDGRAALYETEAAEPVDLAAARPGDARRMQLLARGFHAWGRYLLGRNRKRAEARP